MKKIILIFAAINSFAAFAQTTDEMLIWNEMEENLICQIQMCPKEKIYLQTDKLLYANGENVFFKAYVVHETILTPSFLNNFIYVELINPLNVVVSRQKIKARNNSFYGQIKINDLLPEGEYQLRVYNGLMFGADDIDFYRKKIKIVNSLSSQIISSVHFEQSKSKITANVNIHDINNIPVNIDNVKVQINNDLQNEFNLKGGNTKIDFTLPEKEKTRILLLEFDYNNETYQKYFTIPTYPEYDFDLAFFPEGGHLISGIMNQIGFKALNKNGLGENIEFYIIDEQENVVMQNIKSLHRGMGSFYFEPDANTTYTAIAKSDLGTEKRFQLPQAKADFLGLAARWSGDNLRIRILNFNAMQTTEPLYLLMHCRGQFLFKKQIDKNNHTFIISKNEIPSGVSQILLLNKHFECLSERLIFNTNNHDFADVNVTFEKSEYNVRELVKANIALYDIDKKPLQDGDFSISVTADTVVDLDSTTTIYSSLLLSSDLRGYIENPAYYFDKKNKNAHLALDILMLTQGWRKYDIPNAINGKFEQSQGFIEQGQEISGKVQSLFRKRPLENSEVSIISTDLLYANQTRTDSLGHFYFEGLDFPNGSNFVVQAFSSRNSDRVELIAYEDTFPSISISYPTIQQIDKPNLHANWQYANRNGIKSVQLKDVVVTAEKTDKDANIYSRYATNSFSEEFIKNSDATCIHELLRRIPGIRIDGNKVIIRGQTSIYGHSYATIMIDGVLIYKTDSSEEESNLDFDLDIIQMPNVARVDVFKAGDAAIFGSASANGVISIITKKGDFVPDAKTEFNVKRTYPLGYQQPIEFYSPKYEHREEKESAEPDLRTTIYWNPTILTDESGKANINFYTADYNSSYTYIIEGITADGKIIYSKGKINVGK